MANTATQTNATTKPATTVCECQYCGLVSWGVTGGAWLTWNQEHLDENPDCLAAYEADLAAEYGDEA